ncbi:phosphoenolpyruvate--protein phosphotransferase [Chromobacterium subtsugae]|uniref:phosphoenolpyruvate--protein phosphotransferase n=4 Tax=Chromobacterium subtsugae TaxID=251747 RepID=A0ABS7FCD1_9NEIS|nr:MULTISPECIES: phosphoenolpyruvate--protein phosphotransferase [Chromobacterium]KZE85895.1 PTS fructose transporter subunit IIA [Chromobacterium sp. F49]MBW7567265.1 phosphoenolpyruvate--protein phosphotransferase [Chromobacterium subtsugae]MBW8287431.1 phosphoenolpyruvate--protein phosphotransferase [Chromobacterium subtsugae]WSE93390.1 phosphoenolpyruvate--protein phosphotransferase [Chromobacterium subtsugae]WVH61768.1 phosphoenolpyruvate--protein phosphotransferase [Chromobacterium subts
MSDALLNPQLIRLGCRPADKDAAIREAGALLEAAGCIAPDYIDSLLRREAVANTYLGNGIAIPHGMAEDRAQVLRTGVAILQIPDGLEWNPGQRIHLLCAIAARSDDHLVMLRQLTRLLQDEARLLPLFTTTDSADLLAALAQPEAPLPPDAEAHDLDLCEEWRLDYPNGLHARPAALWVEAARRSPAQLQVRHGSQAADAKNLIALLQLGLRQGALLTVSARGPQAADGLKQLLRAMREASLAEQTAAAIAAQRAAAQRPRAGWQPSGQPVSLPGIAASPGLAIGTVRVLAGEQLRIVDRPVSLAEGGDRLHEALAATRRRLAALADATQATLGAAEAGIFRAQAELLNDTDLITLSCQLMVAGHGVEWSWHQAVERLAEKISALGNPLLAARAADLRDVGRRVLLELDPSLQGHAPGEFGPDTILLAADLAPSDTASLDLSRVKGLATAHGGPTAHTAILARTLGLPALVAAGPALLDVADGSPAILDGDAGRLYLNPSEHNLAAARDWQQRQREAQQQQQQACLQPGQTADGRRVEIAANLNRPEQVAGALNNGAEGVGLMRTEFLFLERDAAPDEEEQYQTYLAMQQALQGRPLIVRALDIGGDKQVPYLNLPVEDNPFLGVRGARLLLRRRELLEPQLRALYRAAKAGKPLSIMFPMISSLKEITRLKGWCEGVRKELDAPPVPIGIMVEVPAAALLADQLAPYVDFFSIGTNDLTQYALAMDRQHPELAAEADSLHPAVLRLIRQTVRGAAAHQRWVGVCGGSAGDPLGAAVLAGLGVDELSMSPSDIPAIKAMLRRHDYARLQALAEQALSCDSAEEVRQLLEALA